MILKEYQVGQTKIRIDDRYLVKKPREREQLDEQIKAIYQQIFRENKK